MKPLSPMRKYSDGHKIHLLPIKNVHDLLALLRLIEGCRVVNGYGFDMHNFRASAWMTKNNEFCVGEYGACCISGWVALCNDPNNYSGYELEMLSDVLKNSGDPNYAENAFELVFPGDIWRHADLYVTDAIATLEHYIETGTVSWRKA